LLPDLSAQTAVEVIDSIKVQSRPEDLVILSVHWGGNWGYTVPEEQIRFAHMLIDSGAVDVVHGHSSHHVRPLEIYRGKLIMYGAGDFLNDYEGIERNEGYRDDLALIVLPDVRRPNWSLDPAPDGSSSDFRFSLRRASAADALWLREVLNRESSHFGTRVKLEDGQLEIALDQLQP
jgi:Putative enzyme of poly-gamma-glutamate biosynthesis (capsule formation)